ncbi:MAG: glycosyltransferase family 4 protein [Thermodesulfobacteriota bacterium]
MKKVLILFSMSFEPYQGRYLRAYNEARALVDSGYEVTVLGWDRSGKSRPAETRDGIHIERIHVAAPDTSGAKSLPNFLRFAARVVSHLGNRRFDMIHCHNLQLLPLAICLKTIKKAPLIFDSCEPDYYALYPAGLRGAVSFLEKRLVNRADTVFVHNNYQVRKYRSMGHPSVSLIGSYPRLDMIEGFAPEPTRNGKTVIGRIGSIYRDNGIEEIMAGFRVLLERTRNVQLFLAGRVFEAFQDEFNRLIRGMEENVTVLGAFDSAEMPRLYGRIDISIMVYRRSLWFQNITPTKFFDSLAFGVPVIVSDMGGLKEIVAQYDCGLVVDEQNPAEVADAMEAMMSQPARRKQMGLNGTRAVREQFNWDLMRKNLLTTYDRLTA